MDQQTYLQTQTIVMTIAAEVRKLQLDEFLNQISQTESAGPMIDPTMYRAAQKNLSIVKKLAHGLNEFKKCLPTEAELVEGMLSAEGYNGK